MKERAFGLLKCKFHKINYLDIADFDFGNKWSIKNLKKKIKKRRQVLALSKIKTEQ